MQRVIFIIILSFSSSATIYIPSDYATIQQGIDVSSEGDTVLVSSGTYVETINFSGKNIAVIGDDEEITIIDGNQNGSVVTFENGEDSTAILNGFSIVNGNNTFGGGISCINASPILENLNIRNNFSVSGGGIFCNNGSPIIKNVDIFYNISDNVGAGMEIKGISNPICSNIAIYENISGGAGGGMFIRDASEPYFDHVTIISNESGAWGGGIAGKYGVNIKITNSILWNNSPQQLAMSEFDDNENIYVLSTNDIENGLESIQAGNNDNIFWLDGNIDVDPDFNDELITYAINSNSPCINIGIQDTQIIYNNFLDTLQIPPYIFDGISPDLGSYEYICQEPAFYDDCNICSDGETGHEPNSDMDDCEICFGTNEDMDCAGICFGDSYIDDCNVCDDIIENDNECISIIEFTSGIISSGEQSSFEILLNNSIGIAGFQLEIEDSPNLLQNINVIPTERTASFSLFSNENSNILYIAGFHPELDIITPGAGPILEVTYEANIILTEQEVILGISNVVLSDSNADQLPSIEIDGVITVTTNFPMGDVNFDETIDILDIIIIVNHILVINELDSDQFGIGDMDYNGIINVLDIIQIINIILN